MIDPLHHRLQQSIGSAFTLERELGGGGMARVFVARDTALERRVVIKVLDLESAPSLSVADRFRREIRVVAQLQHPHIVPILTAGGDATLLWYAMPYVAGESLRVRLSREGALPMADVLKVTREVLDALEFAHQHGIIHRDIKPGNILLEGTHVVVADFGVAKALADAGVTGELTTAGVAIGTPAYMAPEQAVADPTTNHRADLYAVGVMLFEMLVGSPPYSGNAQAVVAAHLSASIPSVEERRSDVPAVLSTLVRRLLAKHPADRPQSAKEVLTVLESTSTPPGDHIPAQIALESRARSGRHAIFRRRLFAVATLVLATIAGAFVLFSSKSRASASPFADGTEVIAVLPMGSTGDSAAARLGRDLVVTLSANLDGVGVLRAVDAMSVLQHAQQLPQPVALQAGIELGSRLGAGSIVHGSIVRDGDSVRADVVLTPAVSGRADAIARVTARGTLENIGALTDTITAGLLRQIWRRGAPPSPVLSEVTTGSIAALRSFLAGEAHFEQWDASAALEAYQRALALDSTFVQAALRIVQIRNQAMLGRSARVEALLDSLRHRLPPRDRDLLALSQLPILQSIDSARVLAARYHEHHTAHYLVSDLIIHYGALRGIPVQDAWPYLERLDVLSPRHADNALHRLMAAAELADTSAWRAAAVDLEARTSGGFRTWGAVHRAALDARTRGQPFSHHLAADHARGSASFFRTHPFLWAPMHYVLPFGTSEENAAALAQLRREPDLVHLDARLRVAEGSLAAARGDFDASIRLLEEFVSADVPGSVRLAAGRNAVLGAWLEVLPITAADAALATASRSAREFDDEEHIELLFLRGLAAVMANDSARLAQVDASYPDGPRGTSMRRTVHALAEERRTGAIDSVRAAEDDAAQGVLLHATASAVRRIAIGRNLSRQGRHAEAEFYFSWTDAYVIPPRTALTKFVLAPYNSYHRARAFEAAGENARAIVHYQRFVNTVDRPSGVLQSQLDDARERLSRLTSGRSRR